MKWVLQEACHPAKEGKPESWLPGVDWCSQAGYLEESNIETAGQGGRTPGSWACVGNSGLLPLLGFLCYSGFSFWALTLRRTRLLPLGLGRNPGMLTTVAGGVPTTRAAYSQG